MSTGKFTFYDQFVRNLFVSKGEVMEVRIPGVWGKSPAWGRGFAKGTVNGYFDDHKAFVEAIAEADKVTHDGIYFTLQVIDQRLLGRAFNRLKPSNLATSDQNVTAYRWLPIDIDPVRPSGVSSSDEELRAALEMREQVAEYVMREYDFPAPIRAVSGNGGHLLFRLPDLSIKEGQPFVRNTLNSLADKFNTDRVTIDSSVFNPARIWKLYGTTACKGDEVPASPRREARPHRMAFIDSLGDTPNG